MRKNLSILIRTSGGLAPRQQLGFGHIYRSTNLADQLKPNNVHFLVEDFGGAKKIIAARGYRNVSLLKKNVPLEDDIRETINMINKKKIDLLVIDRYKLKNRYVRALTKVVKTVVISDLRIIDFPAHLVVNGFVGFPNQTRINRFGTRCVLGPKHQILNKNFAKKTRDKKTVVVLATFGGFDENNIVETLLDAAESYLDFIKIRIILGPGTKRSSKIVSFEKKYRKNLLVIQKTKFMHKEISGARFGICSGGITSYEFAALGVPFAIVSQVRHQLITAKQWEKRKYAYNLGLAGKLTERRIRDFLDRIVENKIGLQQSRLVDGFGSKRVSDEILKLV